MITYYYLSQSDLNLLETCPPQFQQTYLENRIEPRHLKNQSKTQWGKSFHLLMQQYNLGLEIDNLSIDNQQLLQEIKALIIKTKDIWSSPTVSFREAEYQLNYTLRNYIFTVIYDLLIFDGDRARIIDWKTYREPQNQNQIINNWQTKLYLYILAEKFNFTPEKISFDYFFVSSANNIEQLSIPYNQLFHEQISLELKTLIDRLDNFMNDFYHHNINFPHHQNCQQCKYYQDFFKINNNVEGDDVLMSLDDIETIDI